MNAKRIDSRERASSAGSPSAGSTLASGIGWTQVFSGYTGPTAAVSTGDEGPNSIGRARRCGPRTMSRHTLVAIR